MFNTFGRHENSYIYIPMKLNVWVLYQCLEERKKWRKKPLASFPDLRQSITLDMLEKLYVAVPHLANSSYQNVGVVYISILCFSSSMKNYSSRPLQLKLAVVEKYFFQDHGQSDLYHHNNDQLHAQSSGKSCEFRNKISAVLWLLPCKNHEELSQTEKCGWLASVLLHIRKTDISFRLLRSLKSAQKFFKLDSNKFTPHSLIGAATRAHLQDFLDSQIR